MNKKTHATRNVLLTIGLLILIVLIFGVLQTIVTTDYGYKPYGESTNQITDLSSRQLIYSAPREDSIWEQTSKYWHIKIVKHNRGVISGNDFEIINNNNPFTSFTTTEFFDKRIFKTKLYMGLTGQPRFGSASFNVNLVGENNEVMGGFGYRSSIQGIASDEGILEIIPSPVSNKAFIYFKGEKVQEVNVAGKYKIRIGFTLYPPLKSGSSVEGGVVSKIINPLYKQQFGCDIEPDEQYYNYIFKEGDNVNINKLDEFTKFCLDELPAKIYTNIGATTNEEILVDLVVEESYTVPAGQIWVIEYIGKKTTFKTECEAQESYNINDRLCLSRAVLSIVCPEGSFDFEKGYCVVETIPSLFNPPTIVTHQSLERGGSFRFTHIVKEDVISKTNFNIGKSTFNSNGLTYDGTDNINERRDIMNYEVDFDFNNKNYNGKLGSEFKLNNFISLKITNVAGYYLGGLDEYAIEYTFSVLPDFIIPSVEDDKIFITNNYNTEFEGGYVITKTDILGKTVIEDIEMIFNVGENKINIDLKNLRELKIRPYIIIQIPDYKYKFDVKEGLVVLGSTIDYKNITQNCVELGCPEGYICQDSGVCVKKELIGCVETGKCPEDFICNEETNICERTIIKTNTILLYTLISIIILFVIGILFFIFKRKKIKN